MLEWTKTLGRPLVCTRVLGSYGAKLGLFNQPFHLAVHGDEVFVTDFLNHRVQVLQRATGAPLRVLGTGRRGKRKGDLNLPWGIAIAHTAAEVGRGEQDVNDMCVMHLCVCST